jgi:RNA recognition motif-containing protein
MKALEHIDQQAASLDEAEALTKRNAELMNGYLARITELETRCIYNPESGKIFVPDGHPELERLRKQIATLQEIAVEERAKRIYKGRFRSLNFELPADRKNHIGEARRQLATEHPEAFR